jgi:hypothetical protein
MKQLRGFFVAVGVLSPFFLAIYWHSVNWSYPAVDDSVYFELSQRIFLVFKKSGVWEGLKAIYLVRTWKPIMHPILAVPVLLLTHGNVLASIAIVCTFFYLVYLLYIFSILRLWLKAELAALGTFFVGCLSWILVNSFTFNSEIVMMACMTAGLYHLLRARDFNSRNHIRLFGIWFGVGLCMRPVEVFIFFFTPLVFSLVGRIRSQKIKRKDFSFLVWAIGIPAVWYFQTIPSLYRWVYRASFGDYTKITGHREGVSYIDFMALALRDLLGYPFLILLVMAVIAGVRRDRGLLICAFLMGLTPMALGGLSYNGDLRYYVGCSTVLFLAILKTALDPHGRYFKFRAFSVGITALALFIAVLFNFEIFENKPKFLELISGDWHMSAFSPMRRREPAQILIDELIKKIPKTIRTDIGIVPYHLDHGLELTIDNSLLTIIARERGLSWRFERPCCLEELPDVAQRREYCKNLYDYILVGPLTMGLVVPDLTPESLVAQQIETYYDKNLLQKLSLKEIGQISFPDRIGMGVKLLIVSPVR